MNPEPWRQQPRPAPSAEEARQSLRDHVVQRAAEARLRRGGLIDLETILRLLEDRSVVRYPMGVRFDAGPLHPGEFACLEALGERPSDGFVLFVHPLLQSEGELLPLLIAYYIPSVNYGDVATHVEAELFGATLLGMDVEEYYTILCAVADHLARVQAAPAGTCGGDTEETRPRGGGCGCGGRCGGGSAPPV